ncbi:MAG: signal recognition particle protein [Deltaproteobacteria bacterium]|jgi:signal recognition particle subunit SRP54|nr:signal recognition particle protein [Deltaproteobacteria bacterium]
MFESLSDRLSGVFRSFGSRQLTEDAIREGLREVRLALLEADVNFAVVKDFVDRVRDKCIGQEVSTKLTPAQYVIKAVHDELVALLGGGTAELTLRPAPGTGDPGVIMMVGLQGSGKTTSAGKLANLLRRQKMRPLLVPVDVYRPAAIEQLRTLARQLDIPCFASTVAMKPVDIAKAALAEARLHEANVLILDTAGRLHVDEPLMQELADLKAAVHPQEILLVADAMTGQDAVTVAGAFNDNVGITGIVLTKMDGDARGGAALSIKSVTGAPIKFVGTGEKLSDMESFHPDRVAGRILGMGDVLTLIERAQENIDQEEAEVLARKMQKAKFDLEDFRVQMRRVKQIGSLESIMKMIPGLSGLTKKLGDMRAPEKELRRTEAIINSMTMKERRNPDLLNGSRKTRVAKGAGVSMGEVNLLLKQFEQMRRMMRSMIGGKSPKMPSMPKLPGAMPGLSGMSGLPGMDGLSGMEGMMPARGASPTKKRRDIKKERAKRKNKKR